jgi:hypothetical protein
MARQRAFFNDRSPGQILVFRSEGYPNVSGRFFERLEGQGPEELCRREIIRPLVAAYLTEMAEACRSQFVLDDDYIPSAEIYFGIGSITASMCGRAARVLSGTSWCEPAIITLDDLDCVRFDPGNGWIRLMLMIYEALLEVWREDFCFMPTYMRSPLDAAWGLRGEAIFLDLYDCPERVDALLDRCVGWALQFEAYIQETLDEPREWGRVVWGTLISAGAHFVNADPADLLSERLCARFEAPSTAKMACGLAGLFYHHHQMGIRHVSDVADVPCLLVQQIQNAPNGPSVADLLVRDETIREAVVAASLRVPIMLQGEPGILDELLAILKRGRFILTDFHHPRIVIDDEIVEKIRAVSPL